MVIRPNGIFGFQKLPDFSLPRNFLTNFLGTSKFLCEESKRFWGLDRAFGQKSFFVFLWFIFLDGDAIGLFTTD